jgi:hypothetical protein
MRAAQGSVRAQERAQEAQSAARPVLGQAQVSVPLAGLLQASVRAPVPVLAH